MPLPTWPALRQCWENHAGNVIYQDNSQAVIHGRREEELHRELFRMQVTETSTKLN